MIRSGRRVYFIRPIGMTGPVKIGCSVSPTGRKQSLEVWSPLPLEVVAEIDGDEGLERRFHQKFIRQHKAHEWFFWSRELQEVMDAIIAETFDVETLPEAHGTPTFKGKGKGRKWTDNQRAQYSYSRSLHRRMKESGFSFRHNTYSVVQDGLTAQADEYLSAPHVHGEPINSAWGREAQRNWLASLELEAAA